MWARWCRPKETGPIDASLAHRPMRELASGTSARPTAAHVPPARRTVSAGGAATLVHPPSLSVALAHPAACKRAVASAPPSSSRSTTRVPSYVHESARGVSCLPAASPLTRSWSG